MNVSPCDFLFGSEGSVCQRLSVIKRLHLATRGVGDSTSLVRTLVRYRCTHRYLTEGSKVLVAVFPTPDSDCRGFSSRVSSSARVSGPSPKEHSDHICDKSGCGNTESNDISECSGGDEPVNRINGTILGAHAARIGVTSSFSPVDTNPSRHPSSLSAYTSQGARWSSRSKDKGSSSSLFRSCSTGFGFRSPVRNNNIVDPAEYIIEYVVVKCDPGGGFIDESTVFYVDDRLPALRRIELLWDVDNDSHVNRCVEHFLGTNYTDSLRKNVLLRQSRLFGPFRVAHEKFNDVSLSGRVRKTIFLTPLKDTSLAVKKLENDGSSDGDMMTDLFFQSMFRSVLSDALSEFRVFYSGQTLLVRDLNMFVSSTSPCKRPGIITPCTEVYIGIDTIGECKSISVAPLRDTVPRTYEYNLLKDCVEPYFRGHRMRTFRVGDVFMFGGVQFRLISLERFKDNTKIVDLDILSPLRRPERCGRVGTRTLINVTDPVAPQLTDLLTNEQLRHLRRCAPNQRELLLFKFACQLDADSLSRLYGVDGNDQDVVRFDDVARLYDSSHLSTSSEFTDPVQLYNIQDGSIVTDTSDSGTFEDMCTVCCELLDVGNSGSIFTYKCGHRFHTKCANTWINMCGTSCPNCRHRQVGLTVSDDAVDGARFSTLSDSDGTDISNYVVGGQSPEGASASSDSELLRWFNSHDLS